MNKNEEKFIKRGKLIILILGILTIFNIIILIGKNQSYALFRKHVQSKRVVEIHVASEFPSKSGTSVLKEKLGKGGLIGIPSDCNANSCTPITSKNISEELIREYRYSGLGVENYVYFNCKDNQEPQDSTNCEKWRIVGIFKDENGDEHIKLVRNQFLFDTVTPNTYKTSNRTYYINDTDDYSNYQVFWNSAQSNNWTEAGLMYYLNGKGIESGYIDTLSNSAQSLIAETKYYLGNVYCVPEYSSSEYDEVEDTTILAYNNERGNQIWAANQATWIGKIALMYPSDYGFSADYSYWSSTKLRYYDDEASDTSWFYKEMSQTYTSYAVWFISPSSNRNTHVTKMSYGGITARTSGELNNQYAGSVIPSLYLISETKIVGGEGTSDQPYQLQ